MIYYKDSGSRITVIVTGVTIVAGRRMLMSTLEKTIHLLNTLPENQIETIYSFVQFLCTQQQSYASAEKESLDDIFGKIVGVVPDTGKTLEEYQQEMMESMLKDL